MSTEMFVALSGALPEVADVATRLGGADGTWEDTVTAGGVAMHVDRSLVPVVEEMLANAKKRISVTCVVVIERGTFDDAEDAARALTSFAGGALLSEDGDVVFARKGKARASSARA